VVTDTIVVGKGSLDAFVLFNDTIIIEGSTIQLFADVTNAVGVTNYQWTPVTFLDNSNAQNPFATPTEDVLYIVTANNQGCVDTASVFVRLRLPDGQYAIPNAFTPNGDGKNDVFLPYFPTGSGLVLKEMRVYNRWGALVYNGTTGWDGTFNGKPQQAGTFIYYIVVEQPSKTTEGKQGSVTLIR
jgi:gliding motility-associated-like protein